MCKYVHVHLQVHYAYVCMCTCMCMCATADDVRRSQPLGCDAWAFAQAHLNVCVVMVGGGNGGVVLAMVAMVVV